MAVDWQPGDLAVCVDDRQGYFLTPPPEKGCVYRVIGIFTTPHSTPLYDHVACGLYLDGLPSGAPTGAWSCNRFRKIRPDAHEGSAEDWNLLLNTTKRKVSA